jgi:hypothetical protein
MRNYDNYYVRFRAFVGRMQLIKEDIPPDSWMKRRAACIFAMYLYDMAQRHMKQRFVHWRAVLSENRRLQARFFWKWNTKASLLKLQRLNAQRFIYLTRHFARKVQRYQLQYSLKSWQYYAQWQKFLVRIRLLFRCWKTVVQAIHQRKQHLYRLAWFSLRLFCEQQRCSLQERHDQLVLHMQRRCLYKYFRLCWYQHAFLYRRCVYRMLALLQRLARHPIQQIQYAFQHWKLVCRVQQFIPRSSRSLSTHFPSSPRHTSPRIMQTRITYQASTGAVVSRKIVQEKRPKSSAQKKFTPVSSIKQKSIMSPPIALSLRDKIAWRLARVKTVDKEYTEEEMSIRESHHDYKTHETVAHQALMQTTAHQAVHHQSSLHSSKQHATPTHSSRTHSHHQLSTSVNSKSSHSLYTPVHKSPGFSATPRSNIRNAAVTTSAVAGSNSNSRKPPMSGKEYQKPTSSQRKREWTDAILVSRDDSVSEYEEKQPQQIIRDSHYWIDQLATSLPNTPLNPQRQYDSDDDAYNVPRANVSRIHYSDSRDRNASTETKKSGLSAALYAEFEEYLPTSSRNFPIAEISSRDESNEDEVTVEDDSLFAPKLSASLINLPSEETRYKSSDNRLLRTESNPKQLSHYKRRK